MILASRHVRPMLDADPGYMVDIDLAGFGRPWGSSAAPPT